MTRLVDRRHLLVSWRHAPRPDGRRFKRRLNRRAKSVYVQLRRLEIVVWYR